MGRVKTVVTKHL